MYLKTRDLLSLHSSAESVSVLGDITEFRGLKFLSIKVHPGARWHITVENGTLTVLNMDASAAIKKQYSEYLSGGFLRAELACRHAEAAKGGGMRCA